MLLTNSQKNKSKKFKNYFNIRKSNADNTEERLVVIHSSNNRNSIEVKINQLIYINSEGNYVSFYLKGKENNLDEKILRIQMKTVENTLKKYRQFIRCHKSYIVNTNYVNDVSGNARGLKLHLSMTNREIPVSRKIKKNTILTYIS